MVGNMALSTQRLFGNLAVDGMVIFWKQALIWQRMMTIQAQPLTEDQALHFNMRLCNLEKSRDRLEHEVYGIYL